MKYRVFCKFGYAVQNKSDCTQIDKAIDSKLNQKLYVCQQD